MSAWHHFSSALKSVVSVGRWSVQLQSKNYHSIEGKFQKEFQRTFRCWRRLRGGITRGRGRLGRGVLRGQHSRSSTYACRFTTNNSNSHSHTALSSYSMRTEVMPLSVTQVD